MYKREKPPRLFTPTASLMRYLVNSTTKATTFLKKYRVWGWFKFAPFFAVGGT